MKQIKYYVMICALLFLAGCDRSKFIQDEAYLKQVETDYQAKARSMQYGGYFDTLRQLKMTKAEQEAMMFLYAYMPSSDVADYTPSFILSNVRSTFAAIQEMPWGSTIPEEFVRHFVLPIRVNNENLDNSRAVFYEELKDRVKDLPMKEAILEVNHWCHEKVVYQPSSARTSSPLATVKTAHGRCGEESTFTVAALRSVGIPARQVYTPRWAHTDNNHAWVEAWADGEWHFLGACEPEPVLNLGWFNSPASRGMLMHTKVFGRYTGSEEIMSENMNYTEINVIDNYAPTAKVNLKVQDENGEAVPGAKVEFTIYNYAQFYTVAKKYTNGEGATFLTAGKGDMLIWASKGDRYGFAKCSFGKDEEVVISLDKTADEAYALNLEIVPPVETANLPDVTEEQRAQNDCRLAAEDSIRAIYTDTFITKERAEKYAQEWDLDKDKISKYLVGAHGNHETIITFINEAIEDDHADLAMALLSVISAKDLRDVSLEVLEDHLYNSLLPKNLTEQVYKEILNPRVEHEMLTPYKSFFQEQIDEDEVTRFRNNPLELVAWVNEEITVFNELNTQRIRMSPRGVWESKTTDDNSRDIFFVSLARSLGIPAWKDEVTGKVQYRNMDNFEVYDVDFEAVEQVQSPKGRLVAKYNPIKTLSDPKYYTHFTISKYVDGSFQRLSFNEGDVDMGGGATWSNLLKNGVALDEGSYLLVTGTRMASGAVLSNMQFFTIEEGVTKTVDLVMRESEDEVQVIGDFNSESLYKPLAQEEMKSILQTTGRGYYVVGILGVGQEPTNHALRDIAALRKDLEEWGRGMVLLFPNELQADNFKPTDCPGLPSTISYGIDVDNKIQQSIEEAMKLNTSSLPIFIIADTFNRVVFVSQGYTIGLGEQIMKVVHGL